MDDFQKISNENKYFISFIMRTDILNFEEHTNCFYFKYLIELLFIQMIDFYTNMEL